MYNEKHTNNHIIIIGAGGTGSWFAQFLSKIKENNVVTIIDGDIVEPKNLKRQNFLTSHIDQNKAQAVGSLYDFNIGEEYLKSADELLEVASMVPDARQIIVGAVDNNASRKIIHDFMQMYDGDAVWVDGGNSERSGQVIFYPTIKGKSLDTFKAPSEIYPEVFNNVEGDERRPDQISCAEHSESAPQNVAANIMSATVLFSVVNKLLANEAIFTNEITFDSNMVSVM